MPAKLERATFSTSRLLDFASEKELIAQIGHRTDAWPIVLLKELLDNALDACEDAGTPPDIKVTVKEDSVTIEDNGPGIPAGDGRGRPRLLGPRLEPRGLRLPDPGRPGQRPEDHRRHAVRPRRGAWTGRDRGPRRPPRDQPFGRPDPAGARGLPRTAPDRLVKKGTSVRVHWPRRASSILTDAKARFLQIADDYTWLNPHLALSLDWYGERKAIRASNRVWTKWRPGTPTSPHWYTVGAPRAPGRRLPYPRRPAGNGPDGTRVRERVPGAHRPPRSRRRCSKRRDSSVSTCRPSRAGTASIGAPSSASSTP